MTSELEIKKHYEEFMKIIDKYNLSDEQKSEDIAEILTSGKKAYLSPDDFAKEFKMTLREAEIFLTFIERGIHFKENVLGKK